MMVNPAEMRALGQGAWEDEDPFLQGKRQMLESSIDEVHSCCKKSAPDQLGAVEAGGCIEAKAVVERSLFPEESESDSARFRRNARIRIGKAVDRKLGGVFG